MLKLTQDHLQQRKIFPSPELAIDGIVAVGVEPTLEALFEAYSFGIFPWPHADYPMLWFCPDSRGVIDFNEFHVPRRLARELKNADFDFSWNQCFQDVMTGCQSVTRSAESGTWITDELIEAYTVFHQSGFAHSVEVWRQGELVGGLYGVCVGGVFSAESMFFKVSPASKAALVFCVETLQQQGMKWMDIQMVSSLSKQFGGKYISKASFLKRLKSFV